MTMRMTGLVIRRIALAGLLLLTLAARAWAGGLVLEGVVLEPNPSKEPGQTGRAPAEGVTIQILGTKLSTTTDARGAFRLDKVPEGEITIVASKTGFLPTIKKYSLQGPTPGLVNLLLSPTGNFSGAMPGTGGAPGGAPSAGESADTVYVAFSSPVQEQASGSGHATTMPPHGPQTNMAQLGAIAAGADVFQFAGNPPAMSTGPNGFHTNVSAAANQLMVLDPDNPQGAAYVESPTRLFWLAMSAGGTKLFGATDQGTINIYDTMNGNALLGQIPTGGVVNDLVRGKNLVYAAIMRAGGDGVMVIDPGRNAPIRILPTPSLSNGGRAHPWSVAANGDGSRVYVALGNERDGEVAVLDTITTRPLMFAKVGANPMGIALTPDERYLLVSNSKSTVVTVLDAGSLQPVAQVPVGISPFHIAVRPDGTKAYVTCRASNAVHVINLQGMTPGAVIPVGTNPLGVAVTSNGGLVYVANHGSGTVSIIDGNADTFLKSTTPQPRSKPYGVAAKP